jgi:putative oxidoreductase
MDTTQTLVTLSGGLLVARLVLGLPMAAHGAQKLFGWFGGHGLAGTAGFFEMLGFRPGRLFATAAAVGEVAGGLLVALGLLGPVGPALMLSVMIVATVAVHWKNGFFAMQNGIELGTLYATGALALAFTGPGAWSLDTLLGLEALSATPVTLTLVALAIVGGLAILALRRPAPAPTTAVAGD